VQTRASWRCCFLKRSTCRLAACRTGTRNHPAPVATLEGRTLRTLLLLHSERFVIATREFIFDIADQLLGATRG
jgi:hypothetical protein